MADKIKNLDATAFSIEEQDSPTMWQDFIYDVRPFGRYTVYKNDFTEWVPDAWTLTEVNASTQTLLDSRNGILRDTPAGADNDGTQMQLGGTGDGETTGESWAPAAGRNLYFECRFAMSEATQSDVFVGLHVQDTTFVASRGADFIGFSSDDASLNLNAASSNTSVISTEAGVTTIADATFVKVGFKVSGVDKIEYYVNDTLEATITSNIPTALMKLSLGYLAGQAAADTIDYDYVVVAQSR